MTDTNRAMHQGAAAAAAQVDRTALLELADAIGHDGLMLTVAQFEDDALATIRELAALIVSPDEEQLRRAAHRMKGLCRQFGLPGVAQLAAELEQMAAEHLVHKARDLKHAADAGVPAVREVCMELVRTT